MLKVRANPEWKTLKTGAHPCSGHRQRRKSLGAEATVERDEVGKEGDWKKKSRHRG